MPRAVHVASGAHRVLSEVRETGIPASEAYSTVPRSDAPLTPDLRACSLLPTARRFGRNQ